ncbi:MAG: CrcB family protein [Mycobacteriales bacterium]
MAELEQDAGPFATHRPARWPRMHPAVLAAVFVGGCVGGLGRYLVTRAWPTGDHGFPWATLAVNCSGAFVLALLLVLVTEVLAPTTYVRPLLGTGFCGAWTTFSSVVASTDQLLAHGHRLTGVSYLLVSAVGGLAAAGLGLLLGRALGSAHDDDDPGGA